MEAKCQIHALASFSLQRKTSPYLSYCIGGLVGSRARPDLEIKKRRCKCVTFGYLEGMTDRLARNVGNHQSTLCNMPDERRSQYCKWCNP
jgi:hypothetical protein